MKCCLCKRTIRRKETRQYVPWVASTGRTMRTYCCMGCSAKPEWDAMIERRNQQQPAPRRVPAHMIAPKWLADDTPGRYKAPT